MSIIFGQIQEPNQNIVTNNDGQLTTSAVISATTFYSGSTDIGTLFGGQSTFLNGIENISGDTYGIGGDLTRNTTINGLSAHTVDFNEVGGFVVTTNESVDADTALSISPGIYQLQTGGSGGQSGQMLMVGAIMQLQSTGILGTTSTLNANGGIASITTTDHSLLMNADNNTATFTDSNSKGLVYAADYSASGLTDNRWIPDVEAVQTMISTGSTSSLTGSTNGLNDDGSTIKLGGVLTENTTISGGTNNLTIGTTASTIGVFNVKTSQSVFLESEFTAFDASSQIYSFGGTAALRAYSGAAQTHTTFIEVGDATGDQGMITMRDDIGEFGARYFADYSANGLANPRWIPDVSAVETMISTGSSSSNPSVVIVTGSSYTATAGDDIISITASGSTITLPANPDTGISFTVKDSLGDAVNNNITINVTGSSNTIDGNNSDTIDENYGSVRYLFNGIEYILL